MANTRDRIRYDCNDVYDLLTDKYSVFNSYVDCFMFFAAVGYANDLKCEEYGDDHKFLLKYITQSDRFAQVAKAIAYQDTNNLDILDDPGEQLYILGQYAAGGAKLASNEFSEHSGDPTAAVARFVLRHGPDPDDEVESDLQDIL